MDQIVLEDPECFLHTRVYILFFFFLSKITALQKCQEKKKKKKFA